MLDRIALILRINVIARRGRMIEVEQDDLGDARLEHVARAGRGKDLALPAAADEDVILAVAVNDVTERGADNVHRGQRISQSQGRAAVDGLERLRQIERNRAVELPEIEGIRTREVVVVDGD